MSVSNFKDLMVHVGHDVVVTYYGLATEPANVAIECMDCNEVLLDFDNDEE
jgi:hypothetical protein